MITQDKTAPDIAAKQHPTLLYKMQRQYPTSQDEAVNTLLNLTQRDITQRRDVTIPGNTRRGGETLQDTTGLDETGRQNMT